MDGGASMHAKLKLLQSWITRMARRRGGCLNCAATSATVLQKFKISNPNIRLI